LFRIIETIEVWAGPVKGLPSSMGDPFEETHLVSLLQLAFPNLKTLNFAGRLAIHAHDAKLPPGPYLRHRGETTPFDIEKPSDGAKHQREKVF
jgi:hypothetical protein